MTPVEGVSWYVLALLRRTVLDPVFVGLTGAISLCEFLLPAIPRNRLPRLGLLEDFAWYPLQNIVKDFALAPFSLLLFAGYYRWLGFLTIDAAARLPVGVRIAAGFLVGDFLGWFHHWVRHRVEPLWELHKVHHNQRDLNAFTDHRYHPVEYFVTELMVFLPLAALAFDAPEIVGLSLVRQWYTRLCHANIRTDFGWLRYVLVTPQSHRIHHSREARHWNANFGVHLCIWDRLVGTHCDARGEYPETGINDPRAPASPAAFGIARLEAPLEQLSYPIRSLWGRFIVSRRH